MSTEERWQSRRGLATVIDTVVFLAPAGVASATVWMVAPSLTSVGRVWRVITLLVLATLIAWLVGRFVRRLLPLTSLLRLTMVFPDRAPSRFKVARAAGHTDQLAERVLSGGVDEATAAEQILALVGSLAKHDRKTRGHAERVRAYTDLLSDELELDEHARDRLRWAALLHDIGKLSVAAAILNKPGKPDASEWTALKAHPELGARLAAPLLEWLGEWGHAIAQHHERYDGTGYPYGLAGDGISRAGRIVAVVDSFETMTATRSYKKSMSRREAFAELTRCAGSQFDPAIVHAFIRISLSRRAWAMGPLSLIAEMPFLRTLQAGGKAVAETARVAPAAAGTAAVVAMGVATPVVGLANSTHDDARTTRAISSAHGGNPGGVDADESETATQRGVRAVSGKTPASGDTTADAAGTVSGSDRGVHSDDTAGLAQGPGDGTSAKATDPGSAGGGSSSSGGGAGSSGNGPQDRLELAPNQTGADLSGVDLSGMDLSGFIFNGANLIGANLSGANLEGARFTDADLRNADFSDTNATNASFVNADVRGADFDGANLSGADLGSPPDTTNDAAHTSSGNPVTVYVLRNDDAAALCPLAPSSLAIAAAPKHGTVVVNPDHTVTYTPKAGYTGNDQFSYRVANVFGKTGQANVKITVS